MNGTQGTLSITDVDTQGIVRGALSYGVHPRSSTIAGRWDEAGKRLTFHTVPDAPAVFPPFTSTAFTGYLFRDSLRMPGLTGDVVYTLVGRYLSFTGEGSNEPTDQHEFGWYAQISIP